MVASRAPRLLALAAALGTLAGCGSPGNTAPPPLEITAQSGVANGIDTLGSDALAARILDDVEGQDSVRIEGSFSEPVPGEYDRVPALRPPEKMRMERTGTRAGYRLVVASESLSADLIIRGSRVWARGNAGLEKLLGTPVSEEEYGLVEGSRPGLAALLRLGDPRELLESILTPPRARAEFSVSEVLGGEHPGVQFAVTTAGSLAGTLTVSGVDRALPTEIALSDGTGSATLSLEGWGTTPEVAAPPDK
ncbi:hypothetical protein [Mycetocola spongiae]|uniref:hypothetical protein n=1 Tax=Mycetocola spongiae TaxID=2859226 RepID=UPI001CF58249|nr:hypothetical protein [Mycetocola spongiae]UCR89975.1 hypothetical protein KXZ72_04740 [Mycetocola spongiae]